MAPHRDIELNTLNNLKAREDSVIRGSSSSMREPDYKGRSQQGFRRFLDSFKPDEASASFFPSDHLSQVSSGTGASRSHGDPYYYDLRAAAIQSAHIGLARKLKGRHLQMIAIGGAIGTGLFVASGKALEAGGPASLLIAYATVGTMLYCTCQALGELAVIFPITGSFSSWATRFLDPSWGFAMGWT